MNTLWLPKQLVVFSTTLPFINNTVISIFVLYSLTSSSSIDSKLLTLCESIAIKSCINACIKGGHGQCLGQSSGAVWKSTWTSWAPVPNKPMVSVDVKHHVYLFYTYHSVQSSGAVWKSTWTSWAPVPNKATVSVDVKQHLNQPTVLDDDDEVMLKVLGCRLTY